MPRVTTKKKNKAGQPYDCGRCDKKIVAGETYYEWSFRYGGTRRQHTEHGPPRRGQLTQSKLAAVYDAVDGAEDTIKEAASPEDIAAALNDAKDVLEEVKQEYEDACEAMGAAGESGTSRDNADELENFSNELDSAISDIESESFEKDEDETEQGEGDVDRNSDGETESEWLDKLREQVIEALGNLSL